MSSDLPASSSGKNRQVFCFRGTGEQRGWDVAGGGGGGEAGSTND